jgi:glycosyltransferase involved in cell wall biosynthesis
MERVSIVIPTYNRPILLDRLLFSISLQTHTRFEVIVVDDNSENIKDYNEVISKYRSILDNFIYLRNDTSKGAPYCRNKGIEIANSEYIALVDDDDEWLPNKLEEQIKLFINSNEKLGIVYTWTDAVNENNTIAYEYRSNIEGYALKEILKECFIPSPSVMVRKKAIVEAGLFDETFPSCQDWDMWTRIMLKGYSCAVVKSVQTIYHKHNGPTIGKSPRAKLGYKMFYRKHFIHYAKCYLAKLDIISMMRLIKRVAL